ncbi:MAG: hypothetical protein ACLRSW_03595 [Christensenellaceae bacterium]
MAEQRGLYREGRMGYYYIMHPTSSTTWRRSGRGRLTVEFIWNPLKEPADGKEIASRAG